MTITTTHIRLPGAGLLAALALVGTLSVTAATGAAISTSRTAAHPSFAVRTTAPSAVRTTYGLRARTFSYNWPVKPFGRQHPVRGFLNDPRIAKRGSCAFHFGIDISAPDGTAVYAVEAGTVYFDSPRAIAVVALDRSHTFGYWHIVPVVRSHQRVGLHQLLGHIDKGWGHVHFAELRARVYVNPLRNGGLGPYTDRTPPTVSAVRLIDGNLVASAYDTPDPRVPGAWAGEPVAPALVRWRVVDADGAGPWRTVADFRSTMQPASAFHQVYTPATVQNHIGEPGRLWFYLARDWNDSEPSANYTVQVEASDTAGNTVVVSQPSGV